MSTLVVPVICSAVVAALLSRPRVISTSSADVAVCSAIFVPPALVATVKSPFDAVAVVDVLAVSVSAPPAASTLADVDASTATGPASARSPTEVRPVSWSPLPPPDFKSPSTTSTCDVASPGTVSSRITRPVSSTAATKSRPSAVRRTPCVAFSETDSPCSMSSAPRDSTSTPRPPLSAAVVDARIAIAPCESSSRACPLREIVASYMCVELKG